eukprot:CAMPEP_0197661028 /NCGR_PEP_ID=MMETSP1338-20131121/51205_1 /TAXON_ID=43686 ORGANISM="Pelagodinium beii, Strain RCC1491" /NCGR_SAMPLE_ID=MMETSP1338 /ASSEMBLY_ACC=CAM_ASM_000754 /LENGTH=172 /DNA_ID=CAMNT_0043238495 /DNA_START=33 /DNA_END=551 /DNA_ORIENTATION=+
MAHSDEATMAEFGATMSQAEEVAILAELDTMAKSLAATREAAAARPGAIPRNQVPTCSFEEKPGYPNVMIVTELSTGISHEWTPEESSDDESDCESDASGLTNRLLCASSLDSLDDFENLQTAASPSENAFPWSRGTTEASASPAKARPCKMIEEQSVPMQPGLAPSTLSGA